jgi:hypothetical protein
MTLSGDLAHAVAVSEQVILAVPEPERVAIIAPLSLDHLELPLEVGVEADKHEAAVLAVVLRPSRYPPARRHGFRWGAEAGAT